MCMIMEILTYTTPEAAEVAMRALMPAGITAPYNQFVWAKAWHRSFGTEYIGLLIVKDDVPYWFMDFEIVEKSGLRIARNIGESHANFHFPVRNPHAEAWTEADAQEFKMCLLDVLKQHKIDALECNNQLESYCGVENPLLQLTKRTAMDELLYAKLMPDFEAFAQAVRGGSGRKRDRKQDRLLHEIGEWHCFEPLADDKRKAILLTFFDQKKMRLHHKGIADVFSDPRIQTFFLELSAQSHEDQYPYLRLCALYMDDKIIATSGSISNGVHCSGIFNSFDLSIASEASPGLSLQRFEIETLCNNSIHYFDMGAGDARYKRSWLKDSWPMHSFIIPVTFKGRILEIAKYTILTIKLKIKTTPWLWALAQRIRKTLHAPKTETEGDGD